MVQDLLHHVQEAFLRVERRRSVWHQICGLKMLILVRVVPSISENLDNPTSSALPVHRLTHHLHQNIDMQLSAILMIVTTFFFSYTSAAALILHSLDNAPVLHFTLFRRGGKFAPTEHGCDYVNMAYLAQELERTESRFNLTQREVKGNKLVRRAKSNGFSSEEKGLTMGENAVSGIWFVKPMQTVSWTILICCAIGMRKLALVILHNR